LTHKDIHHARIIRDGELAEPGIVRRTIDEAIAAGEEPTKAKVKRAAVDRRPAPGRRSIHRSAKNKGIG
jgi:hypothetical protein